MTENKFKGFGLTKTFQSEDGTTQKQDQSAMAIEVTVSGKKQDLRTIKPYYDSQAKVPTTLPAEAQIVMHALFDCFDKGREVREGKIKDIVWGFTQCGIPDTCAVVGLVQLLEAGYVKFQAPDNSYIDIHSTFIDEAWLRYEKKLLEMVYEAL